MISMIVNPDQKSKKTLKCRFCYYKTKVIARVVLTRTEMYYKKDIRVS